MAVEIAAHDLTAMAFGLWQERHITAGVPGGTYHLHHEPGNRREKRQEVTWVPQFLSRACPQ
jgi:hypothetical protein